MAKKKSKETGYSKNPFVEISASLAGIYLVVVIMFLIFGGMHADLLVPIAWAFVVLGTVSALFAYKAGKR